MLSKLIGKLYTVLLEISLWVILIAGVIGGAQARGLLGAVVGLILAAVIGVVFFGAFIVLNEIKRSVERIEISTAGHPKDGGDPSVDEGERKNAAEGGWL